MASTEFEKRKQEEYEMQLFGFHSRAVYTTLQDIVYENIQRNCRKLFESIEQFRTSNSEEVSMLKANEKQLLEVYFTAAKSYLKNIEKSVNKYINIPPNVLSNEDKCQRVQYSDNEFKSIQEKLENLQRRAKEGTMLNAALKEELEVIEQIKPYEEVAEKLQNVIENGLACSNLDNTRMEFVEAYNEFVSSMDISNDQSQKPVHSIVRNLRLKDYDLNSLQN